MTHYTRIFYEKDVDYVATPTTGTTAPIIRCSKHIHLHHTLPHIGTSSVPLSSARGWQYLLMPSLPSVQRMASLKGCFVGL